MDIQAYIESGVLEEYCLGLLSEEDEAYLIQMSVLYPEIKTELTAIEFAMENLAGLTAIEPNPGIKQYILAALGFNDADTIDLQNLPVISHSANPAPWLKALAHFIPEEATEDFILHVIREDKIAQQMLVIIKNDVPEEEHGGFFESLFILEGRCECTIGDKFYALGAGDFIEIPLNIAHDIKLTTPVVTAILQYRFV